MADVKPGWRVIDGAIVGGDRLLIGAIAVLAVLARLIPVLRGGGLDGILTYDDGVYFSAAIGLVNGEVPYRDFLMLHPPGILYLLAPFAALGTVFGDATTFGMARVSFMILGAINTALVAMIAGRVGRAAAACAGLLYAVWGIAAFVERTTWLVGPQNTLLLLAIFVLPQAETAPDRRTPVWRAAAAGGLLGLAIGIQLWALIPATVVLGWLILASRRRHGGWIGPVLAYSGAVAIAVLIVGLPFLMSDASTMLRYIVADQLGRVGRASGSPVDVLVSLAGLPSSVHVAGPFVGVVVLGSAIGAITLALVAWRGPAMRLWVALFFVQTTFLLVGPVFFTHYAGWLAPAGALSIGAAAAAIIQGLRPIRPWAGAAAATAYALILVVLLVTTIVPPRGRGIPVAALKQDLAGARCVTADSPVLLIVTGSLQRAIDLGCPLKFDPSGTSYDTDRGLVPTTERHRTNLPEYQQEMAAYYEASDAALFVRLASDGYLPETWAAIKDRLPLQIARGPVTVLLRSRPPAPEP